MNLELLLNQYISPAYISTTNMVVPIANISFDSIYNYVVEFATIARENISVFVYTFIFITKQAFITIQNNLSFTEIILLSLCLYNLIGLFASEFDKTNQNNITQDKLEKIEKNVKFLKKSFVIRDNCETMWTEEIKSLRDETSNKMQELEKMLCMHKETIDEQTNIVNENQQHELIMYKKIAQLSKELRKIKKEIEKYA